MIKLPGGVSLNPKEVAYMRREYYNTLYGPPKHILRITLTSGREIDFEHDPPWNDSFELEKKILLGLTS